MSKKPEKGKATPLETLDKRVHGHDMVLLAFFIVWLVIMIVLVLIYYPILVILYPFLGGMLVVFFLTGIPAAAFYWKKGTVTTAWLFLALLLLSLAYTGGLYAMHGNERIPEPFDAWGMAGELLYFYIFALVVLLLYVFVGFGMIWIMTFAQRSTMPDNLDDIKGMSQRETEKGFSWRSPHYWKIFLYRAVMDIPDHLETSTVSIRSEKKRPGFPWHEFNRAFGWAMVFGGFIITLIALNPFLTDLPAFQDIFGITEFVSFFVPLLVLPWFIWKRLDVRIKGQVKDFRVYKGMRTRITRSVLALSTLVIFIRLALPTLSLKEILWQFFQLFMDYMAVVIITCFVYFNYYEEEVAQEVTKEWKPASGDPTSSHIEKNDQSSIEKTLKK